MSQRGSKVTARPSRGPKGQADAHLSTQQHQIKTQTIRSEDLPPELREELEKNQDHRLSKQAEEPGEMEKKNGWWI